MQKMFLGPYSVWVAQLVTVHSQPTKDPSSPTNVVVVTTAAVIVVVVAAVVVGAVVDDFFIVLLMFSTIFRPLSFSEH